MNCDVREIGIVQLANSYVVIYKKGNKVKILSKEATRDLSDVKKIANDFAMAKQAMFDETIKEWKPCVTVLTIESQRYAPAIVNANTLCIYQIIALSQKSALSMAEAIATKNNFGYLPEIGVLFNNISIRA